DKTFAQGKERRASSGQGGAAQSIAWTRDRRLRCCKWMFQVFSSGWGSSSRRLVLSCHCFRSSASAGWPATMSSARKLHVPFSAGDEHRDQYSAELGPVVPEPVSPVLRCTRQVWRRSSRPGLFVSAVVASTVGRGLAKRRLR